MNENDHTSGRNGPLDLKDENVAHSPDATDESRLVARISAPVGTTALINNTAGYLDTLYVQDFSVDGILANGYLSKERYPVNTMIKGILLTIPPCELTGYNRTSLLINEAKVIHSLIDKFSKTVCYGIEFANLSSYVFSELDNLVNKTLPFPGS